MLTIYGRRRSGGFCDGVDRRDFLMIGGMVMGGLSMPQMLLRRIPGKSGQQPQGGHQRVSAGRAAPSGHVGHQGRRAQRDSRPLQPIKTSVPGIEICELFPKIAAMMDRFVPIRSIVGASGSHYSFQTMTGRHTTNPPAGGWPSMGAWISKVQGPVTPAIPPHLSLFYKTGHAPWGDPGEGGFLGMAHSPFRLVGARMRRPRPTTWC